jgi:hypothetical protein
MLGLQGPVKTRVQGRNLVIEGPQLMPNDLPGHNFVFKIPGGKLLPE